MIQPPYQHGQAAGSRDAPDPMPSRPKAARWVRVLGFLGLLALAVMAIWWIDRGVMRTNTPSTIRSAATEPQRP